jgi:hypothetical protein
MVGDEDDPRAPYKVYEDDRPRGTYKTRADGGNSSSKASRRTAQNRIRILASRTDTAA